MLLSALLAFDVLRGTGHTDSWSKRQSIAIMVYKSAGVVSDWPGALKGTSVHKGLAEADVCDDVHQLVFLKPEALLSNET